LMKLLLDHGASPNSRDRQGNTPIHCISVSDSNHLELGSLLIKNGARTDVVNALAQKPTWCAFISSEIINPERNLWMKLDRVSSDTIHGDDYLWVPDNESIRCMSCSMQFTMFKRRHHCRFCGNLVCGSCSTKRFIYNQSTLRSCDSCFNYLHHIEGGKSRALSWNDILASSGPSPGNSAVQDIKDKALQREKKLEEIRTKSTKMKQNAADFHKLATELRKKQEKSLF